MGGGLGEEVPQRVGGVQQAGELIDVALVEGCRRVVEACEGGGEPGEPLEAPFLEPERRAGGVVVACPAQFELAGGSAPAAAALAGGVAGGALGGAGRETGVDLARHVGHQLRFQDQFAAVPEREDGGLRAQAGAGGVKQPDRLVGAALAEEFPGAAFGVLSALVERFGAHGGVGDAA